ncbi:MAG: hypothetical protein SV760_00260 [Halobacteria archaeon]|nr:hypothetical protein [Halobacteria archaeon]
MPTNDYASESDLRYINDLAEIPISGPDLDQFSKEDKLEAAEFGEAKIEADVNAGERLSDPTMLHGKAAAAWASYQLFYGGEHPSSKLSGSLGEGSSADLIEFAREHKSVYKETVESIRASEAGTDDDDQLTGFHVFEV